jgi:hypothetical protein
MITKQVLYYINLTWLHKHPANKDEMARSGGYFFISMLFLSVLSSCTHAQHPIDPNPTPIDTIPTPPTHIIDFGKLSLKKNGTLWAPPPSVVAHYYSGSTRFSLLEEWSNSHAGVDAFAIFDIPCSKGMYRIQNFHVGSKSFFTPETLYTTTIGGDEPNGNYTVDTDTTRHDHNFIEIIDYNPVDSTVEGRFQAYMFKDPLGPPPQTTIPDTVFITEGKFYLKIKKH